MDDLGKIVFFLAVAAIIYYVLKSNKKEKAEAGVLDQGLPFPCVIEGSVDGSPMADRVEALAIEAKTKGIIITGDYVADYKAQGGEMMLVGAFKFTIDAQGQRVDAQSFINLFGFEYPITGGVEASGKLGMGGAGGAGGTSITGTIVNGQLVNGRIHKGALPHIYGVLRGTYRRGA